MAYQFSYAKDIVNANGWGVLFFNLKTLLKSIGWTVLSSSDSITYFPTTDGITHNSTGPAGMANDLAWFRVRQPSGGVAPFAGVREIVFQMVTQQPPQLNLYAKISPASGFIIGSPGATQVPAAADEFLWMGTGTDSSPSGYQFYSYNVPNYTNYYVCANDAAPWEFYVHRFNAIDTTPAGGTLAFGMDSLIQAPVADLMPYVFYGTANGAFDARNDTFLNWTQLNISNVQTWVICASGTWKQQSGLSTAPEYIADKSNIYNSKIQTFPIPWCADVIGVGSNGKTNWKRVKHFKGFSKGIDWGDADTAVQGDRGTGLTTNDKINIGGAWWPWNGGTV